LERHAQLADEDHVERRVQFGRDLVRNGYPSARETEHDDVVVSQDFEAASEATAGFDAIDEGHALTHSLT
jgi:hypothetical protein